MKRKWKFLWRKGRLSFIQLTSTYWSGTSHVRHYFGCQKDKKEKWGKVPTFMRPAFFWRSKKITRRAGVRQCEVMANAVKCKQRGMQGGAAMHCEILQDWLMWKSLHLETSLRMFACLCPLSGAGWDLRWITGSGPCLSVSLTHGGNYLSSLGGKKKRVKNERTFLESNLLLYY